MSAGVQPRLCPQGPGDHAHLRQTGDLRTVVAGHQLAVVGRALGRRDDGRRWLAEIAGALVRRHDQRDPAVAFLAAVEQTQHRLDDPAGALMVLEGDRALVEPRGGVGRRVRAVHHRDAAEVLVGDAVLVHVAARVQRHPARRREKPVGPVHVEKRREPRGLHAGTAETHAGALVEGAVAHDDIGDTGGHRHRRLHHDGAGAAAAVGDAREHRQHRNAEIARHLGFLAGVHRERDEAIDVARREAGVVERGLRRLAGELELAASRCLGELGLADARDGGAAAQRAAHVDAFARGRAMTAVPDT